MLVGIDSLDLGLYVVWDYQRWDELQPEMEARKLRALGESGPMLWLPESSQGPVTIWGSGKGTSGYRYHVQTAEMHLFIQCRRDPKSSPNVYVSINARTIWTYGVTGAVGRLLALMRDLGPVRVDRIQPSRVDMAVDVLAPAGFSFDHLRSALVAKSRKLHPWIDGDVLETFYVGEGKSPIQLRVYQKGLEIVKKDKLWFLPLWGLDKPDGVWRVEFQLRRNMLKAYGIDSVEELQAKAGGLWRMLAEEWASFRLHNDTNTTRRSVEPWWAVVQGCAPAFGDVVDVERRKLVDVVGSVDRIVSSVSGYLKSFAARVGARDVDVALMDLMHRVKLHLESRGDFAQAVAVRAVRAGVPDEVAQSAVPF